MTNTIDKTTHNTFAAPPVRWESVSCNLCGENRTELYHRERLSYFDQTLDFQIVRCKNCGLVYTNPRLSDYNATYLYGSDDNPEAIERHAQAKEPVFIDALNEIKKQLGETASDQPRLLDIGCGSGHFLATAQQQGFQVDGIEPASVSANYATKTFNLPVQNTTIDQGQYPDQHFDVITAWDVIEHVDNPKAVLEQCSRWLKPGGIIALRFPSATWQKIKGVILHQLLASERAVFGATMHLYFFNQDTFTTMANHVGLAVENTRITPFEANTNNRVLDQVKIVSNMVIRGIDALCGKKLGNLEVYCRKTENTLDTPPGGRSIFKSESL